MKNNEMTDALPEGWEVKRLGEVYEFLKTYSFSRDQLTLEKTDGQLYCIHYGDIHAKFENEILDFEIEEGVSLVKSAVLGGKDFDETDPNFLKDGDLVIADASEDYAGICDSIELKNVKNRKVLGGLHTFAVRPIDDQIALGFGTYIFRNTEVLKSAQKVTTGISVFGISKKNLSNLLLPLPPLPEQRAIARILAAQDGVIAAATALLAQKEGRKKWLMQQLLSGKQRLEGFTGEWREVSLGEVFSFLKTHSFPRDLLTSEKTKEEIQCIHYGDIHAKFESEILDLTKEDIPYLQDSQSSFDKNELSFLKDGDLIIADASEDYDGICDSVELKNVKSRRIVSGLHTFAIRPFENQVALGFGAYILRRPSVKSAIQKMATGVSVYGISKSNFSKVKLALPSLPEQTAIARILSLADREIEVLKKQVEAQRLRKRWLMQVLLTGRVRVAEQFFNH